MSIISNVFVQVSFLCDALISVTQTEIGSKYGLDGKQNPKSASISTEEEKKAD